MQNLTIAFPEKSQKELKIIAKAFYRNLCDFMVETLKALTISPEELTKRVKLENPDLLHDLIRDNKTVFTMLGHQMNWEWISMRIAVAGMPADVIYKPLSNDFFENFMFSIRSRFGIKPISMYLIFRDMISRRGEPRVIGTLADQAPHHPDSAYWSDFFHRDTDFFNGTEKLARKFNTPVLFGKTQKLKRGYYVFTMEEAALPPHTALPPDALTEQYVRWLERSLREQPEIWLWSHNRWKHKREDAAEA